MQLQCWKETAPDQAHRSEALSRPRILPETWFRKRIFMDIDRGIEYAEL
jgi:hypothetical protein